MVSLLFHPLIPGPVIPGSGRSSVLYSEHMWFPAVPSPSPARYGHIAGAVTVFPKGHFTFLSSQLFEDGETSGLHGQEPTAACHVL